MKSVKLLDAFRIANHQISGNHPHKLKEKLGAEFKDNDIVKHDDDKAYFIFDYDNKLLMSPYDSEIAPHKIKNSNNEICGLFNHLNTNHIHNMGESLRFIMGQSVDELDIFCDRKEIPQSLMTEHTFFMLHHENVLENEEFMENIFDITCPAIIESPEFSGKLNLANHNQWIDLNTIISAHLIPTTHDKGEEAMDQLDEKSYIIIKQRTYVRSGSFKDTQRDSEVTQDMRLLLTSNQVLPNDFNPAENIIKQNVHRCSHNHNLQIDPETHTIFILFCTYIFVLLFFVFYVFFITIRCIYNTKHIYFVIWLHCFTLFCVFLLFMVFMFI